MRKLLVIAVGVILLAVAANSGRLVPHRAKIAPVTRVDAVAYARRQLGVPYKWGGPTSPGTDGTFDCSGLVYKAYRLPWSERTSQQQWASLPHVDKPKPGDLVFFRGVLMAGEQPPGHVGIVVGPHEMIDAYAVGYGVEYDKFGVPGAKPGLEDPVGYADP